MQDLSPSDITPDLENYEDKRGHKGRERRCVASGETLDVAELIRFVRSPDGVLTPDVYNKLPGRGVWVAADIMSLHKAVKTNAFSRGFKINTTEPENIDGLVSNLLKRRVLGLISMAMKAGHLTVGFDQVKTLVQTVPLAYRIEASDGSEDGRGKIRVISKAVSHDIGIGMSPVIGCFSAHELGRAIGRESMVHGALKAGGFAKTLKPELKRLSGFVQLIPEKWPDKGHEIHSSKGMKLKT